MLTISYTRWLIRLTEFFFGPQLAGQRVRLLMTRDMLDQEFPDLGGAENFLSSTRAGPEWIRTDTVLSERGLMLFSMWKHRSYRPSKYPLQLERLEDAPPFLPYLCLLCLAWTEERPDLEPYDFYARLSGLYPDHGLNHRLGEWECLWRGLELWTVCLNKKWGHFAFEVLGQMSYVGVPKSQVILTPCKVDRLPELWTACNLQPAPLTPEKIGDVIRANPGPARTVLSDSVFTEITRNTPLGQSALVLLGEHLEHWDGFPPKRTGESGHLLPNQASQSTSLMLVLGILGEGESWRLSFGLRDFGEARGLQFPDKGWSFVSVHPGLVILRDAHGHDVSPESIAADWTNGITLTARWHAELGDADPLRLILHRERGVRVFEQAWGLHRLVEGTTLPTSGGLFVLVGPQSKCRWQEWCRRHVLEQQLTDCTRQGLPVGHEVWYIHDLSKLSTVARVQFPSSQDLPSTRPRALRLVGGTRARRNAARRVYARYDPPTLTMCAPPGTQLMVQGASPRALPFGTRPAGLPGETEQRFTIQIDPEASVVIASAQIDRETIETVTFGILSEEAETAPLENQEISVNRYGEVGLAAFVRNPVSPANGGEASFFEGAPPLGTPLAPDGIDNHPAVKLLESLAIDHHGGRVPVPEFRRRAETITQVDPWRLYLETRWLSNLGHIEIQTDSWGRWSYIHQNPPRLYCLPWKSSDIYYAALAGCVPRATREAAITIATSLDCQIFVKDNRCRMVPPRILFAHQELAAFELLAEESRIGWTFQPEAVRLANWAAGLDEWREHLVWHSDRGPSEVAEYVPSCFQVTAAAQHQAPFRLQCVEDPYTRRHRWHKLVHNDAIGVNGLRHAFVRDAAWGMWKAQNAIADDDFTNLPFEPEYRELVVPFTLEFPYLLARALALSSGLAPRQVFGHRAYTTQTAGVLPVDSPPYTGACWAYGPVPQPIAEIIAAKVSAQLKILE